MPSFQISDEEWEALHGLPMLVREIHMFALRLFMNFAAGIVGERHDISWKSIAGGLYVEPYQGIGGGEPSEEGLRWAPVWLRKVDLVGPNLAERRLIFELSKASRDQSVRKKVDAKWADEAGSYVGGSGPSNYAALPEKEGRYAGGDENEKVGTPPTFGNNRTVPNAYVRECPVDPTVVEQWCQSFIRRRGFQIYAVQTARTMPLFASRVKRGVTVEQMLAATEVTKTEFSTPLDPPLHYRNSLDELLLERHRVATTPHAKHRHEQTDGRNAEGQAGHRAAKRGPSHRQGPRSAIDRVNVIVATNEVT